MLFFKVDTCLFNKDETILRKHWK